MIEPNNYLLRATKWQHDNFTKDKDEVLHDDRLQRSLAAYFLFFYRKPLQTEDNSDNGVSEVCSICRKPVVDGKWHNHPCE